MLKLRLYHEMYEMQTPPLRELNQRLNEGTPDEQTFYLRGVANFQSFEFRAATEDFDRAIALKPDFVDAIFHRGIVRVVRGRYDEALEDFDQTIALQSDHAAAHYNRGRLLYWKGNYEGAITNFEMARKLDPLLGRELNLRYVIGKLKRPSENDSVLAQVQDIVNRLMDL